MTETARARRPLWRTILSILFLSFAAHRVAATVIGWSSDAPRELALATAFEAAAAVIAAVCLWIGGRPATVGVVLLGVATSPCSSR